MWFFRMIWACRGLHGLDRHGHNAVQPAALVDGPLQSNRLVDVVIRELVRILTRLLSQEEVERAAIGEERERLPPIHGLVGLVGAIRSPRAVFQVRRRIHDLPLEELLLGVAGNRETLGGEHAHAQEAPANQTVTHDEHYTRAAACCQGHVSCVLPIRADSLRCTLDEGIMLSMEFEPVLTMLIEALARRKIRYAAIGGFALGLLGTPRATMDIDFLVHRDDLGQLHELLTGLGYQRRACTENVSQYAHADRGWGSIDVLHAFRTYAVAMLERTRSLPVFGGAQQVRVLQPEDIIGLKVQAMANDARRQAQETADIEALMTRYGKTLDWQHIQEYFDLFELGTEGEVFRRRFQDAQ